MITPWQIYWVMQLDSIGGALLFATIAALACGVTALFMAMLSRDLREIWADNPESRDYMKHDSAARVSGGIAKKAIPVGVLLALLNAFIPSTKTAAMMLVIPAVANNKAIQREAGDLYGIAKDALRELAKPKPEKGDGK